jgi:hypothetical protein
MPTDPPPLAQQGRNALGAISRLVAALATGGPVLTSKELTKVRRQLCRTCMFQTGRKCAQCGCFISAKTKLATETCPVGRW